MSASTKRLYRFHWDCGRMGDVEGVFVAEEAEIAAAMGKTVSLGEALGKYSDVHGTLDPEDLTVLTDDQSFIEKALEYGLGCVGYNPLSYLVEEGRS